MTVRSTGGRGRWTSPLKVPVAFPNWVVRMDFFSLYPAYGNLVWFPKDPTYAAHLISIVVEEGIVVSAVIDDVWDEMAQKTIN
jgi:hypothetical protein